MHPRTEHCFLAAALCPNTHWNRNALIQKLALHLELLQSYSSSLMNTTPSFGFTSCLCHSCPRPSGFSPHVCHPPDERTGMEASEKVCVRMCAGVRVCVPSACFWIFGSVPSKATNQENVCVTSTERLTKLFVPRPSEKGPRSNYDNTFDGGEMQCKHWQELRLIS